MNRELIKREKTLEVLREGNEDLQRILTSLKVPRTKAITLGRPVHLTFERVTREIAILLIPKETIMLDLEIVPPSPAIGIYYKTKISPLSKKRKRTNSTLGRAKKS